jgi:hypothetical protein
MFVFSCICAYYLFTFEQYLIHNVQHTFVYFTTHTQKHHQTYSRSLITHVKTSNSLFENVDFYFYGNVFVFLAHYFLFSFNILLFQACVAWLSYYFHNEYHNQNTIWKDWKFFKYLKKKHTLHHIYPKTNYFLIDPTFDLIFSTYK